VAQQSNLNHSSKQHHGLLAQKLEDLDSQLPSEELFYIGFDGFRDDILHAVDQRQTEDSYTRIPSIEAFSKRVASAAGRSTNIELILQCAKLGGNAPIMAAALCALQQRVHLCGYLDEGAAPSSVFSELLPQCESWVSLGQCGHSQALEFQDGKLILGKLRDVPGLNFATLSSKLGAEDLIKQIQAARLFACVNWTMIHGMNAIWEQLLDTLCPKLTPDTRYLFVDLCDPAKRDLSDLEQALCLLKRFGSYFHVVLGLNLAEAEAVFHALGLERGVEDSPALLEQAKDLHELSTLAEIVIHGTHFSAAACSSGSALQAGPYCAQPLLMTGAGDHFNAGYCLGRCKDVSLQDRLLMGSATSGYYVRYGKSPTLAQLAPFIKAWPSDS
jgi:hypothetical protein